MYQKHETTIVIIDTGIDLNNVIFQEHIHDGVYIRSIDDSQFEVQTYASCKSCIHDDIGHGSAIAGIILSHNPNVQFIIVKVFDLTNFFSEENKLVFALDYISKHFEFDIINMSLGVLSINDSHSLQSICMELYMQNRIIVSAFDNNGAISFPAAFDYVFGVTSGAECYLSDDFYCVDDTIVNICAKGNRQMVYWKNGQKIYSSGNSYACAHFTGIISKYSCLHSIEETKRLLKEKCKGIISPNSMNSKSNSQYLCSPVSTYKRVCLFPFNKEMHGLVRFSDKLPFELVNVYDTKYSARVGASASKLLRMMLPRDYLIKSIDDIDWNSFDTIILGHLDELYALSRKENGKRELITKIIQHKKNIYAFDDVEDYLPDGIDNIKTSIFIPKINTADVYRTPFGKLYKQDKPVLGVFGTSSKQGKFTLQLLLRYEMQNRGYELFQVGTEPSSLLYGMDLVFPCGYNSTVSIERDDVIYYLNKKIYEASRNADLIIVGGQSGLIPRDESNTSNFDYTQLEFLYATLPDAVVLCINSNDSFEIVERCIKFLEATSNCRVLALAIYPFYYTEEDLFNQRSLYMTEEVFIAKFKNKWEKEIKIPMFYVNSPDQLSVLADRIIDFFSEEF